MEKLLPGFLSGLLPSQFDQSSALAMSALNLEECQQQQQPVIPIHKLTKNLKKSKLYCICGYGDGEMIGCDGIKCPGNNWYHYECLGLKFSHQPRGTWFCPPCKIKKKEEDDKLKRLAFEGTKRKRLEIDEGKYVLPSQRNDTLLLKVEAAEKQSREEMEKLMLGTKLLSFSSNGSVADPGDSVKFFPRGLCRLKLGEETFRSIQSLHRMIVEVLADDEKLTPWAGISEGDKRKRGYAFLPPSYGKFGKSVLTKAGVRFHAAEKRGGQAKKDELANWNSCVHLREKELTQDHRDALQAVVELVSRALPVQYKNCLRLENLHALQPNIHNGLDHLPAHTDSPLNDGFGVVIVTICVHQSADILLLSNESPKSNWLFEAREGELYVLSGDSRNVFDHGVVCPLERRKCLRKEDEEAAPPNKRKKKRKRKQTGPVGRESLNLRFGLHGNKPGLPFFVGTEMPAFYH